MDDIWSACKRAMLDEGTRDPKLIFNDKCMLEEGRLVAKAMDNYIMRGKNMKNKKRKFREEEEEEEEEVSAAGSLPPPTDMEMTRLARYTDSLPLAPYEHMLHTVPEIVNVVTLAEATPIKNSGTTLPLNLHHIATRTSNSYFAPRRFAAVQLAFSSPRCRILVFHTGRIVGTGCNSAGAARLSIARAQRQLAVEADIHLHIRNFTVINQVAAATIGSRLDCDSFAREHSDNSHYDRASFVGLAWRPQAEAICCEIYSTGRANLPGSTRLYDLLNSWIRMLGELLKHSENPELMQRIPSDLRNVHSAHNESTSAQMQRSNDKELDVADGAGGRNGNGNGNPDAPVPAHTAASFLASSSCCRASNDTNRSNNSNRSNDADRTKMTKMTNMTTMAAAASSSSSSSHSHSLWNMCPLFTDECAYFSLQDDANGVFLDEDISGVVLE